MNAALSKEQERVEFVWDPAGGLVRTIRYDKLDTTPYRIANESAKYARAYWMNLIQSGFHRTPSNVPEVLPVL